MITIHNPNQDLASPVTNLRSANFESYASIFAYLNKELDSLEAEKNNALAERDKALEKLESTEKERNYYKSRCVKLETTCADQAIQLKECKDKLQEIQKRLRQEEESAGSGIRYPECNYAINVCDYSPNTDYTDAARFWDKMWELKDVRTTKNTYLIKGIVDVVPIFLVVSRSDNYDNPRGFFCGSQKSFCENWNAFVAGREVEPERRKKLTISPNSFTATLSKIKYTRNPNDWRKKFREGESPTAEYGRVLTIKEEIDKRWY